MTVALAWVAQRTDGREHLYIAADSRTRGAYISDSCPKILTLPRSDCALCFAGVTSDAYPLMIQMAYAIAAHEPARERSMDVTRVKDHLLRLFTDLVGGLKQPVAPFSPRDAQFLFAGYSWLKKDFCIWTIQYAAKEKKFIGREALSFHARLRKAAFIGDWAKPMRAALVKQLGTNDSPPAHLEPLLVLSSLLSGADDKGTIGGPPQVVRISQNMNTRPLCIRWNDRDTLLGRPLFDYENTDYWILDPLTGRFYRPRKFGHRPSEEHSEAHL